MKKAKFTITLGALALAAALLIGNPQRIQAGPDDVQAGAEVHKAHCLKCHGAEGKGDGPATKILKVKPTDWTDKERMSKIKDEELIKIIKEGGESVGKSKLMPAYKEKVKDSQIRQAVAFIRSLSDQKK